MKKGKTLKITLFIQWKFLQPKNHKLSLIIFSLKSFSFSPLTLIHYIFCIMYKIWAMKFLFFLSFTHHQLSQNLSFSLPFFHDFHDENLILSKSSQFFCSHYNIPFTIVFFFFFFSSLPSLFHSFH